MEVNPLNIFFVKSDSKGDRLLFRYPYTTENKDENKQKNYGRLNPYAINSTEDLLQNPQSQTSNICKGELSGFTDEMLSTLFAVKAELCNRKFELKVNDVRFVGHPTLLPYRMNKDDTAAMILINIVFALQASASHSIVKCYYDLSKRLGKALTHEEKRCSYLTEEMKIMLEAHDQVSALDQEINGDNEDEEENSRHSVSSTTQNVDNGTDSDPKNAFDLILQKSSLAKSMKDVFEELSNTGIVQVTINKWVLLSFCLPHKAHQIHNRGLIVEPETIDKCISMLRPYHGILLMVDPNALLASIPLDGSPALLRLIKCYSPLKSLQTLAIEADLTLTQAFQLTGHLVYWAKATVIFPLCEGNVYVVSPAANVHVHSPLVDEFAKEFPGLCLLQMLSEFSLPAPLWYVCRSGAWGARGGGRLARLVAWLLQRRLLMQLHTYVQFNSPHWPRQRHSDSPQAEGKEYFCEKHDSYLSSNISFSSLNQLQLNVPEPVEPREVVDPESNKHYPTQNNLNQTDFSHTQPIVIESDTKYKFEVDSANHSFDEGADVVDGDLDKEQKKANSVDSGISNNEKKLTSRLSDVSLKDTHSSDEDRFESDERYYKNGVSLNLKLQSEMSFQSPTVWTAPLGCDAVDYCRFPMEPPTTESLLDTFTPEDRAVLANIPAADNPDDLLLLAQLHKKGYFRGEQHLEEIMFMENVTRSQLMQLLDKFKEVLITFETEDPAVALLYPY
ncbi:GATOR complex protein NPRL3 [Pieris rapae]|uniref:GATOR complex protein NPRL3 n=1 Tax=Pieris rapae TaxID=64459 RepID=UPI001E27F34E|nr:GATOR complex protein NPRL3 [Pieris rapae]